MSGLLAWWRTAPRGTRVVVVLFGLHVLVKLALFPLVDDVALCCDQVAYDDGAKALSNAVRDLVGGGSVDVAELQRNLVGGGWFTPGTSISMTPLYLVLPDAGTAVVRAYLGVVSTLLLLFVVLRVRSVLGDVYAAVLLVVPGLVPMWLLFSYAAWGDLLAGLLAAVLLVEAVVLLRTVLAGQAPGWRAGVRFGLAAIAVVYTRSSASVVVLGLGVVLGLTVLVVLRGRDRVRAVGALALAGATFLVVLAPWSVFASDTLGARVVTTTTVPVVMANTFGDPDLVCFGPCDPVLDPGSIRGNIWFPPMEYSREVERATGRSEVEVEQQMWAHTRPSVSPGSFSHDVFGNAWNYAGGPASFGRLLAPSGYEGSVLDVVVTWTTGAGWALLAASGVVLLMARLRRDRDLQVVALLTSVSVLALFTQPLVHIGTGRYWTTAAPLLAVALTLVAQAVASRRSDGTPPSRWLTGLQSAVAAVFAGGVLTIVVLGLAHQGV